MRRYILGVEDDPCRLFERWYVRPLEELKKIPNGDGGFIALAISCCLYERYATAVLMDLCRRATKPNKLKQFQSDFAIDHRTAEVF